MRRIDGDNKVKKSGKYQWILVVILLTIIVILGLFIIINTQSPNSLSNESVITEDYSKSSNKIDTQIQTLSPSFYSTSSKFEMISAFYVSPKGSDNYPGSIDFPWKTLKFASQQIVAGDTLFIREGTYQEYFRITNDGTPSAPINLINFNNEEVIIDGKDNTLPENNSGTPLLGLYGNWIVVRNLTIRYSGAYGIISTGANVTLDNLYIHHNWNGGVVLSGNQNLITNSKIWYNSTINENNQSPTRWGSGVSCARYPDYCTIRNSTVWENWGEGISTFEALHTIIEDNISYNNQQNFYISDTKYTILQRNLSYCTPGNAIDKFQTQNGIYVNDEKGVPIPLELNGTRYPSSDNIIINNLVKGCNRNLAAGTDESTNNLYAYNTFVNAGGITTEPYNILFSMGTTTNARFENNIILQEDDVPIAIYSGTGIVFSNNLWSNTPPSNLAGFGDIIKDPLLTKTGILYSPEWFRPKNNSPAIEKAKFNSEIMVDYYGNIRGNLPNIGAIE